MIFFFFFSFIMYGASVILNVAAEVSYSRPYLGRSGTDLAGTRHKFCL